MGGIPRDNPMEMGIACNDDVKNCRDNFKG